MRCRVRCVGALLAAPAARSARYVGTTLSRLVLTTCPYNMFGAVIPAKAGIQRRRTGFRVKPGMITLE